MPYLNVNISKKLETEQKEAMKNKLGELIAIIPGKSADVTIIGINDGYSLYFGDKTGDIAFVEVMTYKPNEYQYEDEFVRAVYKFFNEAYGIDEEHMYIKIAGYETWGFKGSLKK